jgi:hypothetical protein
MERLRIIDLLAIVRAIRDTAQLIAPEMFPNINDPASLYRWGHAVLSACAKAVTLTPTKVDDAIVAWLLAHPFASEEAFRPYYQFFKVVIEAVTSGRSDTETAQLVAATLPPRDIETLLPATAPMEGSPIDKVILLVRLIRLVIDLFGPAVTQQAIME